MSDEYYRHAVWWQTGWGCRAAGFLAVFASELGIISMFLIAFEMSYNTRLVFVVSDNNFQLKFEKITIISRFQTIISWAPFESKSWSTSYDWWMAFCDYNGNTSLV